MSAFPAAARSRGTIAMIGAVLRLYPGRSAAGLGAVFLAGLLDGLGLSMLLSMLSLAAGDVQADPSLPQRIALGVTELLHVQATPLNLLGLAVLLIACKAALTLVANRQVGYTVARIASDLRLALIRAVINANWRYYVQQSVGRLSASIGSEAQRAAEAFQHTAQVLALALNALIYLAIALSISLPAGIASFVAGAVLLLALSRLIRKSRRASRHQTELFKSLLGAVGSRLAAAKPLKAMARESHVEALLSDLTRQLRRALRRQVVAKEALSALQEPLLAIMVCIGFYLGLVVLEMPMASLLVMLFLLARVVNYLSKSQRAFQQVAMRESAYWSIAAAIDAARAQRESAGGSQRVELEREIRFERVSFSYDGVTILQDQSFVLPARELTVLAGPSGAGKTTVLDLVTGLLQPDRGRILVDDVPLTEMDLRAWRCQIGYVPQESVMLNESVAYNVTLGEPVPEEELTAALRAADALEFVEAMAEGVHTCIGEGGSRLSGGQRQRLAIARALIHKPRLLILDEATSNLDPEAQAIVLETLCHLKGKLTMLAVAHQERLMQIADRLYRVEGREIRTSVPAAPAPAARAFRHG
ncbi:MAG: ATP-binding cassette domain-containing protein [Betaproteobacteria bacterium]|nr:ATP-binding cassette domain-containing protein [Betaproteobacteria bacterium]